MNLKNTIQTFLELPIEPSSEWHGGMFPFVDLIGEGFDHSSFDRSEMSDASMALWVALDNGMVHSEPAIQFEPIELLVQNMIKFLQVQGINYRPARIGLLDPELVEPLKDLLAGTGTDVGFIPHSDFWNEVKADLGRHFSGLAEESGTAPSIAESDLTGQQIAEFAIAASEFFRAAIWQHLNDADLLKVTTPRPPKMLKHVAVLGNGRQEYGLGFYANPETHWDLRNGQADPRSIDIFNLTFISTASVSDGDIALWKELELPLVTSEAFPLFLHFSPEGVRLPTPKQFEFVTALLKALALTTEEELDSGQWEKAVSCFSKTKNCKLSIPDLLNPPTRQQWLERGMMPEPRGNERHLKLMRMIVEQNEGKSIEAVNELLNTQLTGSIDDFDYPSESAFDRADNLNYAAIDSYGRRRIQLSHEALAEDPTHVEANNLIAETTFDYELRIERFQQAVELGRRQNEDLLESEVGNFWGMSQTRPFVRAKYGLAHAYESNGQRKEAIHEMLDILRLNSDDNLGVRYEIVPLLLNQNRADEANEILNRFSEETASWLFLKALVEYQNSGPSSKSAMSAIGKALRSNPHVIELMQSGEPPMMPDNYVLGSPDEAAVVINEQLEAWFETDGFVEWMNSQFARIERESTKRDRDRQRKSRAASKKSKNSRR